MKAILFLWVTEILSASVKQNLLRQLLITCLLTGLFVSGVQAQISSVIIPSNVSTGTLEKNVLFYATERYTVTQQGSATLDLPMLFDGKFFPSSTPSGPTEADPTIVLIEGLPLTHVQVGAWVGWSSRYQYPLKFKIEVYNTWGANANQWLTIADIDNYGARDYMVKLPPCIASKLRFTFYLAAGANERMQLSELFFIHPEAARAYDGMMVKYNQDGNVGIGTDNTGSWKLAVNGNIRAKEVKVEAGWSDFVFEEDYELATLEEVERYIREKGHLKGIPSAKEVAENGVYLGKMDASLLQKIEELTLYAIQQQKVIQTLGRNIQRLQREVEQLKKSIKK